MRDIGLAALLLAAAPATAIPIDRTITIQPITERPRALFYQLGTEPVAAAGFVAPIPTGFSVEYAEIPEPATIALLARLLPLACHR